MSKHVHSLMYMYTVVLFLLLFSNPVFRLTTVSFCFASFPVQVNNSCERYFPAWIYLEYNKSCDNGIIDRVTLLFESVYNQSISGVHLVVASFPKHKPHCAVKVHLYNHLSNTMEHFSTGK